ncbi:unnamed protein product [Arabidopsis halleri]
MDTGRGITLGVLKRPRINMVHLSATEYQALQEMWVLIAAEKRNYSSTIAFP